jgi:cation:H+ antiporter
MEGADRVPVAFVLTFLGGAAVSLATSWILVIRLERVGERLGLSEGLLGVLAALAADTPEITSATTALIHHQHRVGAGIIIGSNVFNLAALLGLGAVVAGRIALHRRVVLFGGVVGTWVALACLLTITGWVSPLGGLVLTLLAMIPYLVLLGEGRIRLARLLRASQGRLASLPAVRRFERWLVTAVAEEEQELNVAIRPARGRPVDVAVGGVALTVVVAASVVMERAGTGVGSYYRLPEIVTGGLVLAAVTSLPNAVAAVFLAARGRGAATLSTTLNSNALNVIAGLLLPAMMTGLGAPAGEDTLIAAWYLGLTGASLGFAYHDRGLRRAAGIMIIGAYLLFVVSLLAAAA